VIGRGALRALAAAASTIEPGRLPPADHRPWPLPADPWVMTQTWSDLLFAHWPVPMDALRARVPARLALDTFDGRAWLGVTPFVITTLRSRGLPRLPGVSRFPEINVRTYVRVGDRPGVFFFSLDAGSALAVALARRLYFLPYFRARFTVTAANGRVEYASRRVHRGAPDAELAAAYRPTGGAAAAQPGSLDHWLTERYCLYGIDRRGGLHRAEIHHAPWALQPAEAEIRRNTMTLGPGLPLPDGPPVLHFSARLDVHVWAPEPVDAAVSG
jgi:uncharacterized protein YqjF (DUF2071 family)